MSLPIKSKSLTRKEAYERGAHAVQIANADLKDRMGLDLTETEEAHKAMDPLIKRTQRTQDADIERRGRRFRKGMKDIVKDDAPSQPD